MFNVDGPVVYIVNIKQNPIPAKKIKNKLYKTIKYEEEITAGLHVKPTVMS